ncbi:hypothetical protein OH492_11515 [Vibrio chagasii]|nr:hypothetical protein [Vibrio chagasii]
MALLSTAAQLPLKLWAPTAQDVELVLYSESKSSQVIPMTGKY